MFFGFSVASISQTKDNKEYKRRVLDNVEIDVLSSFYSQKGKNSAVNGGIGTEELTDIAGSIDILIPMNADDILSIGFTVSAYTSASSSNLNPFKHSTSSTSNTSGASTSTSAETKTVIGTPWLASSGASGQDTWLSCNVSYSHWSDDRNEIYTASFSISDEYDYTSIGFNTGFTKLFNQKNTEIGINLGLFLDKVTPIYPTEIETYRRTEGSLNSSFFANVDILNSEGLETDKNSNTTWVATQYNEITNTNRNTYSVSLSLSQILSKNSQFSIFSDIIMQNGLLSSPMQRVYFEDKDDFYIGNPSNIPNYTNPSNVDVFHLADAVERLPDSRLKTPIGFRYNHYINEFLIFKTYYRYYFDDWGIVSNTLSIELPIKLNDKWTLYPSYRYYNQTKSDYFSAYNKNISTSLYYTSDYDLSEFNSSQYGLGLKYTDIFVEKHIFKALGLKNISLDYSMYKRNIDFNSYIISLGFKFIID